MDKKTPKKARKSRFWLWPITLGIVAGLLGFFWMTEVNHRVEDGQPKREELAEKATAPVKEAVLPGVPGESDGQVVKSEIPAPVDPCVQCERDVKDFFTYLDQKEYVRELLKDGNAYSSFKEILQKLAASPPIPSGEGVSPKMIAESVYHFFRVMGARDVRLVREVVRREQGSLELPLENLYRWMRTREGCPEANLKPAPDVLYSYAGFILTTIGGRAYLFRRDSELRLLLTYYSILILHEADSEGKNPYGIDVRPFIPPLLKEISRYPDFQHQDQYIQELTRIQNEYVKSRG